MQYDYEAMGRVIRRLRKARGVTQEVLSGFAAVTRSHLAMIERGQKKATFDTMQKIAAAFDMPLSEIIRLVEEEIDKTN